MQVRVQVQVQVRVQVQVQVQVQVRVQVQVPGSLELVWGMGREMDVGGKVVVEMGEKGEEAMGEEEKVVVETEEEEMGEVVGVGRIPDSRLVHLWLHS